MNTVSLQPIIVKDPIHRDNIENFDKFESLHNEVVQQANEVIFNLKTQICSLYG